MTQAPEAPAPARTRAQITDRTFRTDPWWQFRGPDGGFGFGLGSLIMGGNVVLLWGFTLSCHSCRRITGGRLKNFARHPVRYWAWTKILWLNARHMQLAWITLGTLMLTDLHTMLVASGAISDLRFFN